MALVCLCGPASDDDVRTAIAAGADSIAAVGAACGAGTGCRGCHATIADLLERAPAARCDARRETAGGHADLVRLIA